LLTDLQVRHRWWYRRHVGTAIDFAATHREVNYRQVSRTIERPEPSLLAAAPS
jgi:hypothetical protein